MLNTAKNAIEAVRAHCNADATDDVTLSLYAVVEEQYESGVVNKGLLAKVSSEQEYDEKRTKAAYIKTRVNILLTRKNEIIELISKLKSVDSHIYNLEHSLQSTSPDTRTTDKGGPLQPTERDIAQARERVIQEHSDRISIAYCIYLPVAVGFTGAGGLLLQRTWFDELSATFAGALIVIGLFMLRPLIQLGRRSSNDFFADDSPEKSKIDFLAREIMAKRISARAEVIEANKTKLRDLINSRDNIEARLEQLFS